MFEQLEKKIQTLTRQIKLGSITKEDAKVGKWLNQMKSIDEPCYQRLLEEYKGVIK
jgi:hypothetical protein